MQHRLCDVVALIAVVALAGCSGGDDREVSLEREGGEVPTTASPQPADQEATDPPPSTAPAATSGVTVADAQPETPSCPPIPPARSPDPDRPSYVMDVDVRPEKGVVEGSTTVHFTPDLPTDRLVFRLWPNGPRPSAAGARLEAGPVSMGSGGPVPSEQPDPTTLVVPLGRELAAGERVDATVPWTLTLPGAANDRIASQGGAIRLGSFFPILAWEPGVGWAMEPATAIFAEASTAPVADFSYSVGVPDGYQVLASGVLEAGRWTAPAHRDVGISVGRFRIAEGQAGAPHPVHVVVGVQEGVEGDPAAYLDRVVRSLTDFGTRFGPYPYRSFSLAVTPGLSGGIEYPGHVLQGPGTIGRTTPHEVGHQWFYALVGNNQGRDPWLDEGLASWAEGRFEGTLGEFASKDIPAYARGSAGQPMSWWEGRQSGYYRGVYIQGALALAALGPPGLVDCGLRLYVAEQAFGVARPADLLLAMRQVFPDAEATLARFGAFP
ncbi:MAG: hypothetical protein WD232_03850 [Acidimicrobiales bacterium]